MRLYPAQERKLGLMQMHNSSTASMLRLVSYYYCHIRSVEKDFTINRTALPVISASVPSVPLTVARFQDNCLVLFCA